MSSRIRKVFNKKSQSVVKNEQVCFSLYEYNAGSKSHTFNSPSVPCLPPVAWEVIDCRHLDLFTFCSYWENRTLGHCLYAKPCSQWEFPATIYQYYEDKVIQTQAVFAPLCRYDLIPYSLVFYYSKAFVFCIVHQPYGWFITIFVLSRQIATRFGAYHYKLNICKVELSWCTVKSKHTLTELYRSNYTTQVL